MNQQPRRVTQQEISEIAGVHRTTVCLALQNHPKIPEKTRKRIHKIATRLGYTPDPMLSALAAYRNQKRTRSFQGVLAWLSNNITPFDWQDYPTFQSYYEGAAACAKSYGYALETFELQTPKMSPRRLSGILRARNIRGLLVAPQAQPDTSIDFPWEGFSAVTFGYTLTSPELHCVTATQYRATLKTIEQVRRLGYRRIGFATTRFQDARINHNALAAYLADTLLHEEEALVMPLSLTQWKREEFLGWITATKADAVIVSEDVYDMMKDAHVRIPEDISVACPLLGTLGQPLSGVYENSREVGEAAVDFLVAMMQRGECGVPEVPQRILIEGKWIPGSTLPALSRQKTRGSSRTVRKAAKR